MKDPKGNSKPKPKPAPAPAPVIGTQTEEELDNKKRLASCDFPHDFQPGTIHRQRCVKCKGELDAADAEHYKDAVKRCSDIKRTPRQEVG